MKFASKISILTSELQTQDYELLVANGIPEIGDIFQNVPYKAYSLVLQNT
jgi:hypothetical protein